MSRWALLISVLPLGDALIGQAVDAPQAWRDSAEAYWEAIEEEFLDSVHSPLKPEDRMRFAHLPLFPYDPEFRVMARFKPTRRAQEFKMKTTTDRLPTYRPYGMVRFTLEGRKFKLPVYQNIELIQRPGYEDHLFLPFTDLTNGEETYGGGRYIDLKGPLSESVAIDFNMAYNPYCAYNDRYSCPIPPKANHVDAAVRAGAKKFHD
jgi:uncharacterized protein (DUF1684 family)